MIKRFYYGLLGLRYSYGLTGLSLIIMVIAFIKTRKSAPVVDYLLYITAAALAILMFFYYKAKWNIRSQLKQISDLKAFEKGGMVDESYILEDRMLVYRNRKIMERPVKGITKMEVINAPRGRLLLRITDQEMTYEMGSFGRPEAERFAAFLKRRNPEMEFVNITPKGAGTLKELGAPDY
ncbi:MAG: hypothetical protein K6G61_08725 [Solobacterium sp.]|nr:hypothetical protein [Solobacterium sp.]